jgi:hypothetical protein
MKIETKFKHLKWDHENKIIYVADQLNPPSFNAKFLYELKEKNPEYTIIKKYEN